ncbi:hypothetical protein LCGC14_0693030 [marine sediment metagenome]|uniref:Uncharacterized protein n=1 Tax=marine sediment metagenome TaxID=412755 RepID=A0A0F9T684_9ZZZZ
MADVTLGQPAKDALTERISALQARLGSLQTKRVGLQDELNLTARAIADTEEAIADLTVVRDAIPLTIPEAVLVPDIGGG